MGFRHINMYLDKLPKKLKIGAFNIKIEEVEGLADDGSLSNNTILIRADLSPQEKWETLFHEILHQINTGLKETTVEFLAQALFQVFYDNKLLK